MAGYRLARLFEERGSLLDRGYSAEGEGWLTEADNLMASVSAQTRPAAKALSYKLHGRWFPARYDKLSVRYETVLVIASINEWL